MFEASQDEGQKTCRDRWFYMVLTQIPISKEMSLQHHKDAKLPVFLSHKLLINYTAVCGWIDPTTLMVSMRSGSVQQSEWVKDPLSERKDPEQIHVIPPLQLHPH
ncbi:hypothetical protein AMECASPLE_009007 [Ameca splendens]|uniref:Uncharacterized protein n=1 Tax=Ameca splendens TaxID=208324 RepID=A0ABV0YYM1_9TELE